MEHLRLLYLVHCAEQSYLMDTAVWELDQLYWRLRGLGDSRTPVQLSQRTVRLLLLTGPLPSLAAHWVLQVVAQKLGADLSEQGVLPRPLRLPQDRRTFRRLRRLLKRCLRGMGFADRAGPYGLRVGSPLLSPTESAVPSAADDIDFSHGFGRLEVAQEALSSLREALAGRRLTLLELKRQPQVSQLPLPVLLDALQLAQLRGEVGLLPGVRWVDGRYECSRCGSTDKVYTSPCASCGLQACPYCEACASLGQMRGCGALYLPLKTESSIYDLSRFVWQLDDVDQSKRPPQGAVYSFSLTSAQKDASRRLTEFVLAPLVSQGYRGTGAVQGPGRTFAPYLSPEEARRVTNCLVWAACGAGKTEVAFAAIGRVLERGGRVLLSVPRRQVAEDLYKRAVQSFPDYACGARWGGCAEKVDGAQLLVCTTHQCLRFHAAFDLLVLDECDAFPYQGDPLLGRAVHQALKPGARRIYMTATPSATQLRQARGDGRWLLVTIPARHHGWPLPEPKFVRAVLPAVGGSGTLPKALQELVQASFGRGRRLFVFVPTRKAVPQVVKWVRETVPQAAVAGVHAGDEKAADKQAGLRSGSLWCLVSTTLLSRGITVPNVDVLVLWADAGGPFSPAALVQMAGRSGRSGEYPEGDVWFAGRRRTEEIRLAQRWIAELNEQAARAGYLRKGSEKANEKREGRAIAADDRYWDCGDYQDVEF